MQRILVVDDDGLELKLIKRLLKPLGLPVSTARDGREALEVLAAQPVSLLLSDVRMDGMDGATLLKAVRRLYPQLPVLMMTSHSSIDMAVEFIQQGAADFITKPLDARTLLPRVQRIFAQTAVVGDLRRQVAAAGRPKHAIVGDAPAMRVLLERLPIAARTDSPILVTGETGVGKELVARAIHTNSPRAEQPFIAVNCGAVPATLLASELFGHVKGAFTDARADKQGLVGEADGGTLFLDEIAEMTPDLQVKLLRFLQEGEIRPVGSAHPKVVNVRVVAATHRALPQLVADGGFRQDLFYRLNVIPLSVPALRERRVDIPLLAIHLLNRHVADTSRPDLRFSPAALGRLAAHDWPGNVRELENVVRRAAVFARGSEIDVDQLDIDPPFAPAEMAGVDLDVPFKTAKDAAISALEIAYAEAALEQSGGNLAQAARRVGLDRKSFWALTQRHDLDPDRFRQ